MRRAAIMMLAAAAAIAGCNGPTGPDPGPAEVRGKPDYFALWVQQDGKKLVVQDHQVTVSRKDFDIIMVFLYEDGVLVNVSTEPTLFDIARSGGDLQARAPFDNTYSTNAHNSLILGSGNYDYWYHYGEGMTKFRAVQRQKVGDAEVLLCQKPVATVRRGLDGQAKALDKTKMDAVYLVLVRARAQAGGGRLETQRDWVKINFTD